MVLRLHEDDIVLNSFKFNRISAHKSHIDFNIKREPKLKDEQNHNYM